MTSKYFVSRILALFTLGNMCQCANILYISTLASPSHNIWDKTLAMGLAGRNHKITYFTHSLEKPAENFTPIFIEGMYERLAQKYDYMEWLDYSTLTNIQEFFGFINMTCAFDLESKALQTLLAQAKSGVKYDLIIIDQNAGHCLYPLIDMFGSPPVIGTSPYGLSQYYTFAYGINLNVAYNPLSIQPLTDKMSLWERANNFFYTMVFLYWRQYNLMPVQQKLAEDVFGKDIRPLHEVEKTFSLLLTNTDPVLHYPQPVPPAIIQVGGLHTRRAKSLSKDLLQYLEESKYGVIYFAFGTNIRSDGIEPAKIQALLDAFSQLKENVLWKFESDLPNLPANVLIRKWMPQNDILAHPKVKLFLTHGGGLSTQEAMYHGVPVVGVPFFVDQHVNMRKMVARKLGVQLDYKNITSKNVLSVINEVRTNEVYKKNAQAISRYYKDKPQDALETAIFWVEYVLRHGGAEHLSVAARDMALYQLLLLDILAIVALAVLIVIFLVKQVRKSAKRKQKVKKH